MQLSNEFFTVASLGTLGGSAMAVWVVTSAIGYLMGPQNSQKVKKWAGLILSLVFAFIAVLLVKDRTALTWGVAVVNGCLIYLTALGGNALVSAPTGETRRMMTLRAKSDMGKKAKESITRGRFRDPWW